MEFWFINSTNAQDTLQLPVNPSSYSIKTGNNNTVIIVEDLGEVNLLGKPKLAEISLKSFFPNQRYYFCQYSNFPTPYDCVNLIENWRSNNMPIRLVIPGTDVNILCSIEEFEHGEDDGTGDVNFTLTLKEYKVIPS